MGARKIWLPLDGVKARSAPPRLPRRTPPARPGMSGADGAPAAPPAGERSYAIAFREVWEAALATVESLSGWTLIERDPRAGELRLDTSNRLGRAPLEARVQVWLDDLGQTRVDVHFAGLERRTATSGERRRASRFLARLDRRLSTPTPR